MTRGNASQESLAQPDRDHRKDQEANSDQDAVAAEFPKTVFKTPFLKCIANRLVYAGFYRRRCQAKTRKTRSPYVWAEIHKRDLTESGP